MNIFGEVYVKSYFLKEVFKRCFKKGGGESFLEPTKADIYNHNVCFFQNRIVCWYFRYFCKIFTCSPLALYLNSVEFKKFDCKVMFF